MTYDTAELKRLMEEATPGPWFTFANGHCVGGTPTDGSAGGVAMCSMAARTPQEVQANAALVVAAVNALPALLARVEELERALKAIAKEQSATTATEAADRMQFIARAVLKGTS